MRGYLFAYVMHTCNRRKNTRLQCSLSPHTWLQCSLSPYTWLQCSLSPHTWLQCSLSPHTWLQCSLSPHTWLHCSLSPHTQSNDYDRRFVQLCGAGYSWFEEITDIHVFGLELTPNLYFGYIQHHITDTYGGCQDRAPYILDLRHWTRVVSFTSWPSWKEPAISLACGNHSVVASNAGVTQNKAHTYQEPQYKTQSPTADLKPGSWAHMN